MAAEIQNNTIGARTRTPSWAGQMHNQQQPQQQQRQQQQVFVAEAAAAEGVCCGRQVLIRHRRPGAAGLAPLRPRQQPQLPAQVAKPQRHQLPQERPGASS